MKHGEICNSCDRSLNIYSCGCKQSLKIGFLREKQPSIILQKDSVLFCFLFMCYRWPFRFWDKNFTKIQKKKKLFILPKPYNFLSLNPSSRKPSDNKRNKRFTTAQVDNDGTHCLFLQFAHLHTGNTQTKLQT